ncbi:MAG: Gfo/Idh/MocA family oxidoreductase [Bacteroidetes bacterium]|nr:Gfo/Idh/MocA family oxidoreductase [Bacteroidota bacterium]
MNKKIKWGILGGGRIARKFAADLQLVNEAELVAMASRDAEKVSFFANEFKVKNLYHSYEELVRDPEVDVIYIATPHAMHHEHALLCIENNKAVLCEKAFAINTRQAKEMIEAARARNVFLMEALWSKFLPHYNKVQQLLKENLLGDLKSMLVNFGFIPAAPAPARLFDPALGGGTLLDIGIYNVFMVLSVLGKPDSIEASATLTDKNIDEQCAVLFKYKNGTMAQLFSSFTSNLPTEAEINGDKGRIRLTTRFYEPSATIEYYPGYPDSKTIIPVEKENGLGYQYEARHVCECLQRGLTESPVMTHADTLLLMETLDAIRAKAGIKYLVDQA